MSFVGRRNMNPYPVFLLVLLVVTLVGSIAIVAPLPNWAHLLLSLVAVAVLAGPARRLLLSRRLSPGQGVRTQLAFSLAGLLYFGLLFGVHAIGTRSSRILLLVGFFWAFIGAGVIMLHLRSFMLVVGRRLPLIRRGIFYSLAISPLVVLVCVILVRCQLFGPGAAVPIAVAYIWVALLTATDFSRYPEFEHDSAYDPLARNIAHVLTGKLRR
jgi:hypothetical protein